MKKFLPLVLVCLLFLAAGCLPSPTVVVTTTTTQSITSVIVVDPNTGAKYAIEPGRVGMANIDNKIINYSPGKTVTGVYTYLLNGKDSEQVFTLTIEPYFNDSYTSCPDNVAQYVSVSSPNLKDGVISVPAMGVAALNVSLTVPDDAKVPDKWAFQIEVVSAGSIRAINASRWLVDMR